MVCVVCGRDFIPRRPNQRSCSTLCCLRCVRVLRCKELFRLSPDDLALRSKLGGGV